MTWPALFSGCHGNFEVITGDGPLPMAIFELLEYIVNEVTHGRSTEGGGVGAALTHRTTTKHGLTLSGLPPLPPPLGPPLLFCPLTSLLKSHLFSVSPHLFYFFLNIIVYTLYILCVSSCPIILFVFISPSPTLIYEYNLIVYILLTQSISDKVGHPN